MLKLCSKRHSNIVRIVAHGDVNNFPYYYIDMELCDLDLSHYIANRKSESRKCPISSKELSPKDIMNHSFDILKDVTRGVAFIHAQQIVHRDIKPQNSKL